MDVIWDETDTGTLFTESAPQGNRPVRVPKAFLATGELVALHRQGRRWQVLYRVLYRLTHGEPWLLDVQSDSDVRELTAMSKSVTHDLHQMKAFVRFREQEGTFVAWYQPDHFIVEKIAPWFRKRFAAMRWSILTPDACAHWDTQRLWFTEGVPRPEAPQCDDTEDLWRAYYASTFNPARVNVSLLRQHMPERRWQTLPEARTIRQLALGSYGREDSMLSSQFASATPYIPETPTLEVLRDAIHECRGCELWECATQPVFGEGPADARIVFVGEQPGDSEDREGRPFRGPAGQVFDRALTDAGLHREFVYITGAVKHFRFEQRGKTRIHKTASKTQIAACQPWLDAELELIRPYVIVALGNTAVLSVVGRGIRLLEDRGKVLPHRFARGVIPTVHRSFILRIPDSGRQNEEYGRLVEDIRTAAAFSESLRSN